MIAPVMASTVSVSAQHSPSDAEAYGFGVMLQSDSHRWLHRATVELKRRGFRVSRVLGHASAVHSDHCILVVHAPDLRDLLRCLGSGAVIDVLVTRPDPDNLKRLGRVGARGITWEGELDLLSDFLVPSFTDGSWRCLSEAVAAGRPTWPPALTAALKLIVSIGAGPPQRVIRTLKDLSLQVGCSTDYLSRIARANGLNLRRFLDRLLVLRSINALTSGATLSAVRRDLGYTTDSAVYSLFKRVAGVRPRELGAGDIGLLTDGLGRQLNASRIPRRKVGFGDSREATILPIVTPPPKGGRRSQEAYGR